MNHSPHYPTKTSNDPSRLDGRAIGSIGMATLARPLVLLALFSLAASCGGSDTPTNNPGGTAQSAVWDTSDWDQSDWQ